MKNKEKREIYSNTDDVIPLEQKKNHMTQLIVCKIFSGVSNIFELTSENNKNVKNHQFDGEKHQLSSCFGITYPTCTHP